MTIRPLGIICMLSVMACAPETPMRSPQDPSGTSAPDEAGTLSIEMDFEIRDTVRYGGGPDDGHLGVLFHRGELVDSVDLFIGVLPVPDVGLIYLPVETTRFMYDDGTDDVTSPTMYVLFDGKDKRPVSELLPHFDGRFSSPGLADGTVYYWGLERLDQAGRYRIYAMRAEPGLVVARGTLLAECGVYTGFRFYFMPPGNLGESILFSSDAGVWRLTRELSVESEELTGYCK